MIVWDFLRERETPQFLNCLLNSSFFFFPNISSPFHSPLRCTANLDGSVVKLSTTVQNPPLPQKARDQRQLSWALNRTGRDGTGQDRVEEERKEEKKRRGRVQLVDIFKDHLIISSH